MPSHLSIAASRMYLYTSRGASIYTHGDYSVPASTLWGPCEALGLSSTVCQREVVHKHQKQKIREGNSKHNLMVVDAV